MKQQEIRDIIKHKVEKISKLCEGINDGFDADTIHKFRISVKKLRSLLRLLRSEDEHAPGLNKKFKKLYHIAGHIRDNSLAIEKISGKKLLLPGYLELLHNNGAHYKKEWQNHYSAKVLHKLGQKLTAYEYQHLSPPLLSDFLHKSLKDIEGISNSAAPPNDGIHSIRKTMKDMLYLSAFVEKKWEGAHKYAKTVPAEALEDLTNIIGRFNDERLSLSRMADFARQGPSGSEKNKIEILCNEEAALLTEQKKYILSATKDFLTAVKMLL